MLYAIYVLLGVTVSWMVGFLFVRIQLIKALYNSLIAGFTASILSYVLIQVNNTHLIYPTLLLVYIIMMPLIVVQMTDWYRDSIVAFLIAAGMEGVVLFSCDRLTMFVGQTVAVCVSVVVIAIIGCAMYSGRRLFPEENWMEFFKERVNEDCNYQIKIYHVFLLIVCAFVEPAVGLAFIYLTTIGGTIAAVMIMIILYLGSTYGAVYLVNHKKLQMAIGIERQYRNDMQSFMNIIRSQRHDYSFHVQTLAGLLNNNLEACRKYVNELVADSVAMNTMLPVEDPAIAAMINSFRILAARAGIDIHIDIQNDLSTIVTNAYETNKIISNLLQNAIDEVKTHSDKSYGIWLYIFKRGEYCNIRVANELEQTDKQDEQFKSLFQHGYTTKTGHDGVGLSSIQSLAKRHHGLIYFFLEENVIHFVAEIPIKLV